MSEKDMAQKIKELRLARNMTLEQVANIVGVGKSTVRKWETGMIANMRRDKIASLAQALGTTPAYLMGWEDKNEEKADRVYLITENSKMQEIVKRIKCRREELGLSFQQLADMTNMSNSTLQRYETGGIKNIPLDKLEVLAKALQTTPEWILGWDEPVSVSKTSKSAIQSELLVLARHLEKIPNEQRQRLIKNFEENIDFYLDTMKIPKEDQQT